MKKFKVNKRLKQIICTIFVLVGISTITILCIMFRVQSYGQKYILDIEKMPKDTDAMIILGAGLTQEGTPSDLLRDRLDTALEVYDADVCDTIVLSGDHGSEYYNEVGTMKKYIVNEEENVDQSRIFLDHAGFNTYDSMYRAKNIFGIDKAIIVTNEYHLPRALYIARNLGIDAYGMVSDKRVYRNINSYTIREKLAQVKAFLNINIFKPESESLGNIIPVNTSDGRVTDDDV